MLRSEHERINKISSCDAKDSSRLEVLEQHIVSLGQIWFSDI